MRLQPSARRWMAGITLGTGSIASAQPLSIDWYTIDSGGAGPNGALAGGDLTVTSTIGQPDAGTLAGGSFVIRGGFWFGEPAAVCYANCDGSTSQAQLTPNDFTCFLNAYVNGQPYANCDGSTAVPILTPNDFQCFVNAFAGGCS